jgi:hypothetical protein
LLNVAELAYLSHFSVLVVAHRFWVLRAEWCQKWCQSVAVPDCGYSRRQRSIAIRSTLQGLGLIRHPRLRVSQLQRRAGEAARLGNRAERGQEPQLHLTSTFPFG